MFTQPPAELVRTQVHSIMTSIIAPIYIQINWFLHLLESEDHCIAAATSRLIQSSTAQALPASPEQSKAKNKSFIIKNIVSLYS
jgi:hypothetical protein